MSISEQVKELRENAKNFSEWEYNRFYDTISRAADTIESLSAKLADMERSAEDCGGGWIKCDKDNLPDKEVLCCDQCGEMILGYVSEDKTSDTGFCAENDNVYMYNCVKWMEKPKP
jgi:rubrerythrin